MKQAEKKTQQITTKSGFTFAPPEHLLDDWDFLSVLGRMASPQLTDMGALSGYFDVANILLGEDGLERLKAHVQKEKGYASFTAMREEIEDALSKLRESEGNSSSSPEQLPPAKTN